VCLSLKPAEERLQQDLAERERKEKEEKEFKKATPDIEAAVAKKLTQKDVYTGFGREGQEGERGKGTQESGAGATCAPVEQVLLYQ
jgi:hypothetical protein